MRRGMRSLALQVQQSFGRDPFAGDLYIFRGRRGDLCKIIWHDGVGMSLYAKRLERGKYIWPLAVDGVIAISPSQMACMLEARSEEHTSELQSLMRSSYAVFCLKKKKHVRI